MLDLTYEQCINYHFIPIDYEYGIEIAREKNENAAYDMVGIMQHSDLCDILDRGDSKSPLPDEFRIYYEKYLNNDGTAKADKVIFRAVLNEYKGMKIKINNFAERWGRSSKYIKNELLENDMLLLAFAKDPGRQTFHQHYAATWIQSLPFVENFEEPSSGGGNALYVVNGVIVKGEDKHNQKTGKSIDFKWEYSFGGKTLRFYASHKHTDMLGGAQDNQYKDVQEFLSEARNCIDQNMVFFSITDGTYYTKRETSLKNINCSKVDYLNRQFCGFRNRAVTCNSFVHESISFIVNWLRDSFSDSEVKEEIEKLYAIDKACRA